MASTPSPVLTEPLRAFTLSCVGSFKVVRFCGWEHAESMVWELRLADGASVFLKHHRQPRKFLQELRAYEMWLPMLEPMTPTLMRVRSEPPYALLLSKVPGALADKVRFGRNQELDLYRQAGRFLHALHTLPFDDTDEVSVADALLMRLDAWLPRFRPLVSGKEVDWVVGRLHEVVPLVTSYRRVPCHRDYTPRNWLIDMQVNGLKLYVIDFEHARPELRLLDFERLWTGQWVQRSDLKEAFFDGYGLPLTDDEEGVLERCAAFGALITIAWAHEHGDAAFEQHGRQVLARLHGES